MIKEVHSLAPIVDERSEILILGSMPGTESLRKSQYYAHPRNHFWPILYALFDEVPAEDYSERVVFLKAHRIALWDVIRSCQRKGSSDGSISEVSPNDIEALLREFSSIRLIILNGAKAEATFRKQVLKGKICPVRAVRVPSTSPVPGRNVKSYNEKLRAWKRVIDSIETEWIDDLMNQ